MSMRELARAEWRRYFDGASRQVIGERVELDVASLELGARVEAPRDFKQPVHQRR